MHDLLGPLILFASVMSLTPGPNVVLVTASAANFGFGRELSDVWPSRHYSSLPPCCTSARCIFEIGVRRCLEATSLASLASFCYRQARCILIISHHKTVDANADGHLSFLVRVSVKPRGQIVVLGKVVMQRIEA